MLGDLEAYVEPSWRLCWAHLGPMLGHLGAHVGPSWAILGAMLGLCWPILRLILAHFGTMLGQKGKSTKHRNFFFMVFLSRSKKHRKVADGGGRRDSRIAKASGLRQGHGPSTGPAARI